MCNTWVCNTYEFHVRLIFFSIYFEGGLIVKRFVSHSCNLVIYMLKKIYKSTFRWIVN